MTPVHHFWFLDLLDIFLVAVLFYRLLILVKGTRSAQMYVGLLVIAVLGYAFTLLLNELERWVIPWKADH